MHYKYLNNNVRTFVEFLDQSICALFRPAPRIFTLALEKAPPRPFLVSIHEYRNVCIFILTCQEVVLPEKFIFMFIISSAHSICIG